MSKRRSTHGKRCPRCRINIGLCFCNQIVEHITNTRISIIMHHREEHLTSNTAKLATMTLSNATIYPRGLPEAPFSLSLLNLEPNVLPIYLFPDDGAVVLDQHFLDTHPGPYHLIVPDGTWSQTMKVRRREPGLSEILCVKLSDEIKGEYKLRRGVREDGVCTFEAIAYALEILENKEVADDLLRQFRIMNNRVAKSRSAFDN
ncbi:MAG: tRNA-uridine aminocarboxypropyltransferase [Bacteriovorax sp.]|nr:tRNA-uridine aminocarboxypropyltransferase [Bacteriovorax sp.]